MRSDTRCCRHMIRTALCVLTILGCSRSDDRATENEPGVVSLAVRRTFPPDTVLSSIRDIGIGDSVVWIAASGEVPMAMYSLHGGPPTYPVTQGRGPDQLRSAYSLDVDESGSAIVWDGELGRVVRIQPSGSIDILYSGDSFRQLHLAPRWDYLGGRINQVSVQSGRLTIAKNDSSRMGSGDLARSVLHSNSGPDGQWEPVHAFSSTDRWLDSVLVGGRLFAPFPLWQRCGRDTTVVYTPEDGVITYYDLQWRAVRRIPTQIHPRARTDSIARDLFYRRLVRSTAGRVPFEILASQVLSAPVDALAEAASTTPSYVNLICTESGTVLLEQLVSTMAADSPDSRWEVYEIDLPPWTFVVPDGFTLMAAKDSLLVGFNVDSLDVPSLAIADWPDRPHH